MASRLENSIEYLKGVGPVRAEALRSELGISTWNDLLEYFPFRYVDRSQVSTVASIASEAVNVQLQGKIVDLSEAGTGRAKRLVARFRDETGDIELVWFKGHKWLKGNLKLNVPYILYGKPTAYKGKFNIAHPELEIEESARFTEGSGLKPVYNSSEKLGALGLNSNGFAKLTRLLVKEIGTEISETLPDEMLGRFRLMPRSDAFSQVHMPTDAVTLESARRRLKFEELFFIQMGIVQQKLANTRHEKGVVFDKVGKLFNEFYSEHIPFELTNAQKKVLREIRADVARGHHMNRLLQGDVGSGKTMVALLCALLAIDNGFQACIMAPTEILAMQHMDSISGMLAPLNVSVQLLTGNTSSRERRLILSDLASNRLNLLIGTHALIEPRVQFANLGLTIIDEQHRFGVAQRAALWKKAILPPHVLVMTATPIPRTLAMTLYGDLDVSTIDELPPGRKSIVTKWKSDARRIEVFQFMEDEIRKGRQVYVVYPLIEESETQDYKDLMDGYESMARRFPLPQFKLSIVHGKMKPEARHYEMEQFVSGKTNILVATTVIEVGVNVPNASVMVIESAERFGLSQLHQLRGRVGRGAEQSYCILMSGHKVSAEARKRLETMTSTNDGFEIAEVDLQLRGPGDLAGTQQSGVLQLKIADLARDQQVLVAARNEALDVLDKDPELKLIEHQRIRQQLARIKSRKSDWSGIS